MNAADGQTDIRCHVCKSMGSARQLNTCRFPACMAKPQKCWERLRWCLFIQTSGETRQFSSKRKGQFRGSADLGNVHKSNSHPNTIKHETASRLSQHNGACLCAVCSEPRSSTSFTEKKSIGNQIHLPVKCFSYNSCERCIILSCCVRVRNHGEIVKGDACPSCQQT